MMRLARIWLTNRLLDLGFPRLALWVLPPPRDRVKLRR
jgi:hypothetical protein